MIRWAQWKQQRVVNSAFRKSPLKSLKCNNPLQDKGVPRLDVQRTPHQTSQPLAHMPVSCRCCAQPLRAPKPREGGPCSRPCFPSGCLRIALPSCCLGRAPSSGPAGGQRLETSNTQGLTAQTELRGGAGGPGSCAHTHVLPLAPGTCASSLSISPEFLRKRCCEFTTAIK